VAPARLLEVLHRFGGAAPTEDHGMESARQHFRSMAGVDGLLRMLVQSGGDELRLVSGEPPRMSQRGSPLRLSFPPTDEDTLRHLLEPLLAGGGEGELGAHGRLERAYRLGSETFAALLSRSPGGALEATFRPGASPRPSAPAAVPAPAAPVPAPLPSAPTSGRLSGLLEQAVAMRATDLHLFTGEPPTVRESGRLHTLTDLPAVDVESLLGPFLDESARAKLAQGGSVDFAFELPETGRFRANLYRASDRLAAALRVLSRSAPRLGALRFPVPLDDLIDVPHGLLIVCGPTGSGKSTTLAALADEALRRRGGVLLSLEDPIEYTLRGEPGRGLVRQRQIGTDVRDFPTGLRDALREDPDILLIGEMRDPETISLALTAAETGHLVLTSLHSRSASSSIERIVDAYPPERQVQIRVQLADALRAVVAQRLVPRARGAGRVPALEILRATHGVASLIREGKTAQLPTAIQSSRKEGMLPLERCLADLVRAGEIERSAALALANDPSSLTSYLQ
jgi:twitching motility protein PilT